MLHTTSLYQTVMRSRESEGCDPSRLRVVRVRQSIELDSIPRLAQENMRAQRCRDVVRSCLLATVCPACAPLPFSQLPSANRSGACRAGRGGAGGEGNGRERRRLGSPGPIRSEQNPSPARPGAAEGSSDTAGIGMLCGARRAVTSELCCCCQARHAKARPLARHCPAPRGSAGRTCHQPAAGRSRHHFLFCTLVCEFKPLTDIWHGRALVRHGWCECGCVALTCPFPMVLVRRLAQLADDDFPIR